MSSIQEGTSSASAYIVPYIFIDRTWNLEHPGYSVSVSEGLGNTAPAFEVSPGVIPEPGTLTLILAALGLMPLSLARRSLQTA